MVDPPDDTNMMPDIAMAINEKGRCQATSEEARFDSGDVDALVARVKKLEAMDAKCDELNVSVNISRWRVNILWGKVYGPLRSALPADSPTAQPSA